MSDDFKNKNLKKRLAALHEDYEAANDQLNHTLGEVERRRIQRAIGDLEREIQQVERDLGQVKTSGISASSQTFSPELDDLREGPSARGLTKLLNDWKWLIGTLIAIIGCIGTWLAVPGIFTFFQGTVTTTPTAISTVAGVNIDVTPDTSQPPSEPLDIPTLSPPPTVSLVSTSTMVAIPTQMPTSEAEDRPIILEVCPEDEDTGEIVPDATVEIKVKGDAEFSIRPKGNGCTELAFHSFYKGQSGLLTVSAEGYQIYEEYVDIVDGTTVQVELERLPTPTPANTPTPAINATIPVAPTPALIQTATPSLPSGRIAFPIDDGQGNYDVWVIDLSTNNGPYLLVNDASQPNFSIKGELLVKTTRGISWLDNNNTWRGVVSESGFDSHPFWDPDGIRYVFDNYRLLFGRHESNSLMFIPCSLRPPSQETDPICREIVAKGVLTTGRELSGEYPVWLDDRIAFRRSEYIKDSGSVGGSQEIGQRGIQLISSGSTPGNIERGIGGYSSVSELKLDGRPTDAYGDRIFFFSSDLTGQEIPGDWEAYSVKADGTDLINLSNNPTWSDGMPTVSSDGQWVAFVSNRGGSWGIWLVASNGSGEPSLLVDISEINPNPWGTRDRDWTTERITWGP